MISLQDAKNRFSAVVDAALSGRPQAVSRRGKPAVVIIAAAEYERLLAASGPSRGSFTDHILDFPEGEIDGISARPRDVDL
ncbi:MAG: type II toxin-antitoxin system Phd/YefM family antitoxin [Pseudomonadota bacterium]